jgi:excinuclease ABC subunit C
MLRQRLDKYNLPDNPGVYIFRDIRRRPLYIGRATSLKDRVKSYFANDIIVTRGPRIIDMVTKARSLTWQETDSVLEAIILESNLIKRYQPFYNIDERDDKSSLYVVITEEEWPRVFLERVRDFDQYKSENVLPYEVKRYFGPFIQSGLIKEALKIIRKLFPYKDKKSLDPRHEAFYRSLGQSPDGSDNLAKRRYQRTIKWLILFFEGKKNELRKELNKKMKGCVDDLEFEEANRIKKLLYALDHINDIALLKREKENANFGNERGKGEYRIEAYDIAHLSGTEVVGVMVASVNGEKAGSEYRKFKISRDINNDIANLIETLSRRLNHTEWTYPDLIVVDGNETHRKAAMSVLQARRITIPVVAVTKDARHKAANILGNDELIKKYSRDIVAVNAEAHRFAITYHRLRRSKVVSLK